MDTLVNWIACMMISINDTDWLCVLLYCVATSIKWHEIAENHWCLLCTRHYAMHNNNHHCANVSNAIQKPKVGSGQCYALLLYTIRSFASVSVSHVSPHFVTIPTYRLANYYWEFSLCLSSSSSIQSTKHTNTHAHSTVGTLSLPLSDNTQHENFINGTGIW